MLLVHQLSIDFSGVKYCGWLGINAVPGWTTTHDAAVAIALHIAVPVWGFAPLVPVVVTTEAVPPVLDAKELKARAKTRAHSRGHALGFCTNHAMCAAISITVSSGSVCAI
jgi:hypothetical protein